MQTKQDKDYQCVTSLKRFYNEVSKNSKKYRMFKKYRLCHCQKRKDVSFHFQLDWIIGILLFLNSPCKYIWWICVGVDIVSIGLCSIIRALARVSYASHIDITMKTFDNIAYVFAFIFLVSVL